MPGWPEFEFTAAPVVLAREFTVLSQWVRLAAKIVAFPSLPENQTYHCLAQADTVGVLALTPTGRVPLVAQFRPAVERIVWELPAGMVDDGDTPEICCRRELHEEVGVVANELVYLGEGWPDTGRLSHRHHGWFARVSEPAEDFRPEPDTQVAFVTLAELRSAILSGSFPHQLHVAVVMQALLRGLLPFADMVPASQPETEGSTRRPETPQGQTISDPKARPTSKRSGARRPAPAG